MADNKKLSSRGINKKIDNLNTTVDNLYNIVYSTRVDNQNDLDRITDDIDNNLNDLLSSVNNQNISNISNLIIRLQKKNGSNLDNLNKELESLVSDKSVIDTVNMENVQKYIQAENYQYDLILKYVPKLKEALEIMKDNVLSSDNYTKDFINVLGNKTNDQETNIFNSRAKILLEKYDIQELFEDMYIKTAKYGEYFLYQVPYKIALKRLMDRRNAPNIMSESTNSKNGTTQKVIFESVSFSKVNHRELPDMTDKFLDKLGESNSKVILKMDPYGIIPEAVNEVKVAIEKRKKYSNSSLNEAFTESVLSEARDDNNFNRGLGALSYDTTLAMSNDGTLGGVNRNIDNSQEIRDMVGCVLYEIPRENIIPLYIGNYCIGYYYFGIVNDYINKQVTMGNQYNSLTSSSEVKATELDKQTDMLVSYIASQLSQAIDTKFINNNIDLKDEIYAILRYNDQFNATLGVNTINVSFIPASDIHHFYFKLDEKSHRGISDLQDSIVPAMLYALLYLTDIINKVSRSQDKRIYYVKQNVETNVARTMLNVINQLKKGNMGMRQLENMNTIFNVIGKYNDFIIPRSSSGESPIDFEVMQGQNTDTPTELMDRMEESAVNRTDVPYEFVQSVNQVDYATRFTMSNSKFLRKVFKRQMRCQKHFTQIFRKLYNFEYNENETSMEIRLPAPTYMTMTNSQTLIDNTKNFAQAIADIELADKDDLKPEFIKLLMHNYLGTYLDYDMIAELIEQAKQNMNKQATQDQDLSALDDGGEY